MMLSPPKHQILNIDGKPPGNNQSGGKTQELMFISAQPPGNKQC
jgi:hypothetical protein